MSLVRPRYLALAFAAFFGVVCYYAAQEGRRAGFGAYGPAISQTVFQTSMVGGVLVLLGLFITAAISPHIKGAAPSRQRHEAAPGRREESGPRPAGTPALGRGSRRGPGRGSLAARAPRRTGERHAGGGARRADRRIGAACASRYRANEGLDTASPRR